MISFVEVKLIFLVYSNALARSSIIDYACFSRRRKSPEKKVEQKSPELATVKKEKTVSAEKDKPAPTIASSQVTWGGYQVPWKDDLETVRTPARLSGAGARKCCQVAWD